MPTLHTLSSCLWYGLRVVKMIGAGEAWNVDVADR
jgi:hypothetical protein